MLPDDKEHRSIPGSIYDEGWHVNLSNLSSVPLNSPVRKMIITGDIVPSRITVDFHHLLLARATANGGILKRLGDCFPVGIAAHYHQ